MSKLKPCPQCGCHDQSDLELDSERIANASWVECSMCGFRLQDSVPEQTIARLWNQLDRSSMPHFEED